MNAPRLEIDLDKIHHNAHRLVRLLAKRGISVTGVTKAVLGSPAIANTLLRAGVVSLGDSHVGNIEKLRRARLRSPMTLIRGPMLSEASRVVAHTDVSFNTELDVIRQLSVAALATDITHGIVLMVELGDLREGIMPEDLHHAVGETLRLPNIALKGLGTNLACRSGVVPNTRNMGELSALADSIDARFGLTLDTISGGNSANLPWALEAADTGRINNLRLGESILLGREPLHRTSIEGLHTDAITLVAEVIESKVKPSQPLGRAAQGAFGWIPPTEDRGLVSQAILALGHQDCDPEGLGEPPGVAISGASSDHLIVQCLDQRLAVGTEVSFEPNYSALLRAMTSPFVAKNIREQSDTSLLR